MDKLRADILDFFKDLNFREDTHTYYVKDKSLSISVSGMIKKYKHPTDWDSVLKASAKKWNTTPEELSRKWKENGDKACAIGNVAHLFGENYTFDRSLKPSTGYEKAITRFWNDLPSYIVPLLVEVKMYHKKKDFAGTADILLYNKNTGQVYVADYKTNKDLFKNYKGQTMIGPFNHLLDTPFNHYQLQLSYYQILLEQIEGLKISGRKLIWIKPTGDYLMYNLEDYTKELKQELGL